MITRWSDPAEENPGQIAGWDPGISLYYRELFGSRDRECKVEGDSTRKIAHERRKITE